MFFALSYLPSVFAEDDDEPPCTEENPCEEVVVTGEKVEQQYPEDSPCLGLDEACIEGGPPGYEPISPEEPEVDEPVIPEYDEDCLPEPGIEATIVATAYCTALCNGAVRPAKDPNDITETSIVDGLKAGCIVGCITSGLYLYECAL